MSPWGDTFTLQLAMTFLCSNSRTIASPTGCPRAAFSCILGALFVEETGGHWRPRHLLQSPPAAPRSVRFCPGANEPLPSPMRISTASPANRLARARSGIPSALKSPVRINAGLGMPGESIAAWKPPLPSPRTSEIPCSVPTARSGMPSPSKSAAARADASRFRISRLEANSPSPVPGIQRTPSAVAKAMSGWPSRSKSAVASASGFPPIG